MSAKPESEMWIGRPTEVENIGLIEALGVTVGGDYGKKNALTSFDAALPKSHIVDRDANLDLGRTFKAK
jgi:hypothetical protein